MTAYQFRSIMAALLLIASNSARSPELGILITTVFIWFVLSAIWSTNKRGKGPKSDG